MKKLLIFGAGQYGHVAKEIAESMCCFEKIDFLDDNAEVAIGRLSDYKQYVGIYDCAAVAIGNPQIRLDQIEKINGVFEVVRLISPHAYVSPSAAVGQGGIIEPMAVINSHATIGVGCIISAGAVINHNSVLYDGCHVDCNAVIAARAEVPLKTKVLSCTLFDNISFAIKK